MNARKGALLLTLLALLLPILTQAGDPYRVALPIVQGGSTPTATATPSVEPPRNLDPRLDALGVTVQEVVAEPGQAYWRVVEIVWRDEQEAAGLHHIRMEVLDEEGQRVVGQPLTVSWADGSATVMIEDKPPPEYGANFPMYAAGHAYSLRADGLPSDSVHGMGLGSIEQRDWSIHVEYWVIFQRTRR